MGKFNHIWKHYHQGPQTPEQYIERYLTRLEQYDRIRLEFEREFQAELFFERERRAERIQEALLVNAKASFEGTCFRIVSTQYGDDPLCTYGSLVDSGRFNFGSVGSFFNQFDCSYLGNCFETAFSEKFHYTTAELSGSLLTPQEMALCSPQ